MNKSKKIKIVVKIDPLKVAKGHQSHRSGAGLHHDRRTKRNRTRGAIFKSEIRAWN